MHVAQFLKWCQQSGVCGKLFYYNYIYLLYYSLYVAAKYVFAYKNVLCIVIKVLKNLTLINRLYDHICRYEALSSPISEGGTHVSRQVVNTQIQIHVLYRK